MSLGAGPGQYLISPDGYLALIALIGLALNLWFHIVWFDSAAALAAVPIVLQESRSAWKADLQVLLKLVRRDSDLPAFRHIRGPDLAGGRSSQTDGSADNPSRRMDSMDNGSRAQSRCKSRVCPTRDVEVFPRRPLPTYVAVSPTSRTFRRPGNPPRIGKAAKGPGCRPSG
jgi:hypothetical protein